MPVIVRQESAELDQHKTHLKENGWSYRTAAREIGVTPQYLSDVLNGWQSSPTVPSAIMSLGKCPEQLMSTRTRNRMTGGEA